MSVVIETTLGDITVDLYLEQRPVTCLNFLKLCKMKYYNFNLFHTIRNGFIAQTGDPTGEGSGGESIWGLLEGPNKRFFSGEKMPKIRHTDAGLLSMVCTDDMMVGSQFFFTLAPDLDSLDGVHCVIGEVTEGQEVLTKLNEVICDETHRPYQDVRITHTVVLEDPFNDLPGLRAPSRSPSPNAERLRGGRIAPDEEIDETQGKSHQEIQEIIEEKEAKARATILEIVGDLPDADIAPPENVLFVCKLNPVTTDDDLEIIFSRFGKIVSCEVIRDKKTGDSLQYAFIEFEDKKSCEDAYFKMDNVLIDDRRIHVDFSQSVSKMRWLGKGRGVQYFNEKDSTPPSLIKNSSKNSIRERNNSDRQHYKERDISKRDDRHKAHKDDRHNDLRRERKRSRSTSRKDRSNDRYTKSTRNHSNENYLRESRSDRTHKSYRDNTTNKHENSKRYDNYNRNNKPIRSSPDKDNNENSKKRDNYDRNNKSSTRPSPERNSKKENLRSPIRNEVMKEHKRSKEKVRNNDRHSDKNHRSYEKDAKDDSHHKKRKHEGDSSQPEKKQKRSKKSKSEEVEAHTPSPVLKKSNVKSRKNEKEKKKRKNNIRKNKNKRKASTSSSESESSDSSSSSSESTSSSGEDKRKKRSKRRKRHSSSSSSSSTSSSSSSSTSSTSNSSTESSISSSDNDKNRKRRNTKVNTKSSKKTTKKL